MDRPLELLVVEDDAELSAVLCTAMRDRAGRVRAVGTLADARAALRAGAVDAILLDVCLPDGQAEALLSDLAEVEPLPVVVAISGGARPEETFRLAQAGVRAFVPKPLDLATLFRVWAEVLATPPELRPHLRGTVGRRPLMEVESDVREVMVSEALARASGSRRGAARLLHVSRQLLQNILRRAQGR
jgi:DNA-binding NtrC family response regulator